MKNLNKGKNMEEKQNEINIKYSALINRIKYEIFELKELIGQGFNHLIINNQIEQKYVLIYKLRYRRDRRLELLD